jgi:hypothetical protein
VSCSAGTISGIDSTHDKGLGSMCGHRENAEKFNTKIMQPLKKLPILLWLSSTSQALCGYQALVKHVIEHFSSTYETILKHF